MSRPTTGTSLAPPADAPSSADRFVPAHATRSATIHLHAPPGRIFPLFTPEGERLWVPGWSPRYLWPADGAAQVGMTFLTEHEGRESTWIVADFDAGRRAVYTRVTAGLSAVRIEVRCEPDGDGTAATIRYDYVGLTPDGNASIEQMTEARYAEWMDEWEREINAYRSEQQ
jgi:Polyketide cyclase / dehydrase and lipid transport